jgi:hypothetical protein
MGVKLGLSHLGRTRGAGEICGPKRDGETGGGVEETT